MFTSHLPASSGWDKVAELVEQHGQSSWKSLWDKSADWHSLQTTPQVEMDMQCMETRGALALTLDFDPNAFDGATIEALLSTWIELIHQANASDPCSTQLSGANSLQ